MNTNKRKKQQAVKYVTRYGAALCSLSLAPHAGAAIVDLSSNLPGPVGFGGVTVVDLLGDGGGDFSLANLGGRTLSVSAAVGGIGGLRISASSSTITTGKTFTVFLAFSAALSGTQTAGFLTTANQVGWIKINFGGPGGAVTFLGAAFNNTPRGTIHAGGLTENANGPPPPTVPEPSTTALTGLGLLALGAAGVRRRRKLQAERES